MGGFRFTVQSGLKTVTIPIKMLRKEIFLLFFAYKGMK